jgi:hypothetical protein
MTALKSLLLVLDLAMTTLLCERCRFFDELRNEGELQPTMVDPDEELTSLDMEIARVEEILHQLCQKKFSLRRQINARKSPVLRLPSEITTEVFLHLFPYNSTKTWGAHTPLVLGSICSAWRTIAWSTSRLWCTLSLKLVVNRNQHYAAQAALLLEWLIRTKKLPISIEFSTLLLHINDVEAMDLFMGIVYSCAEQWEYAHFNLHHFFDLHNPLGSPHFSHLKAVFINVESSIEETCQIFHNAPQLREVSLQGFDDPRLITLPLVQPLQLTLSHTMVHKCLSMLQTHKNITHFTGQFIWSGDVDHGNPPYDVFLPQLEMLKVHFLDSTDILYHLTTPALRELFVQGNNGFPRSALTSFVTRSSCSLVRLSLSYQYLGDEDDIVRFLSVTPSVIELELIQIDIGAVTMRSLTILPENETTLLPSLRSFTYRGDQWFTFIDLANMLRSRWRRSGISSYDNDELGLVSRLQVVEIDVTYIDAGEAVKFEDEIDRLAAQPHFEEMAAEGMAIQILRSGVPI